MSGLECGGGGFNGKREKFTFASFIWHSFEKVSNSA